MSAGAISTSRFAGWRLRRLAADRSGVTIVEFALIAPVFLLLLLGLCDLGQRVYAQALLTGAVQQAARSASLETGNTDEADAHVEDMVQTITPGAEVKSTRLSYYDFADLGRPEKWNDINGDGTCAGGETYADENRNGRWDSDIGVSSNGGAGDVVIYTVDVVYPPLFGVPLIPGGMALREISASSVRKNQPFADQARYSSTAGSCA